MIAGQHHADAVGKAKSVYQAKEQSQEIIDPDRTGREFTLKQIGKSGDYDGDRDQYFHQLAVDAHDIQHAQRKRKRVPDGESGDQYQYLLPVAQRINSGQGSNKELMIQCVATNNVFPAFFEIKNKVLHRLDLPVRLFYG